MISDRLNYDPIAGKWSLRVAPNRFIEWEGDPFDPTGAERIADAFMIQERGFYPAFDAKGRKIYVTIPED